MVRKASFLFLLALMTGSLFKAASAQTVDEVINNHVNALGGKDKLASIQSVYLEGVAVMQNGAEINSKIWKVQDKLYRREISFGMGNMVVLATDKKGWRSNPQNGGAFEALPDDAVKNMQAEMDCSGPLVNYAAKGHKAELLGREDINGTSCYKIKLTLKTGQEITYFVDPTTWYVVRESRKGGGMMMGGGRRGGAGADTEVKIDYSNYKKTDDGFIIPMTVTPVGMGGSMNIEKVEVNKPVDAALYQPK